MALETSPSLTSTSHTLTALPAMGQSDTSLANGHVLALLESLREGNRHAFLQPTAAIPTDSLGLVKDTLEGFAGQVGDEQQERLKENRKRKRVVGASDDVLKMRKVYIDGFETGQVWQQAKRIIGSVLKYSEEALADLEERDEVVTNGVDGDDSKTIEFGEDGFEVDSDEEAEESDEEASDEEVEIDEEDQLSGEELEDDEDDEDDDEEEDQNEEEEEEEDNGPEGEYTEDPHGLNDGFFSIDDFNKQTQWFEDQDARGDPNTDQASDDEEIDWAADPMAESKSKPTASKQAEDEEPSDEEDDDDEAGPTFGDMSLDAPEGESDDEDFDEEPVDDEENDMNANGVYYKDFFAPPPKKYNGKPRKAVRFEPKQPDEADVQRAMDDVRRDLFDDESEEEEDSDDDGLSDASAGNPKSRRSAHERRQAKLADEIRKLEAASVAKREWAMSGEASAVSRPMNSLLEEDLEFEHLGKPVPVITPEVTEGIEELIKRRILAQEFDEVIRRRPGAEGLPAGTRRGLVELDDSKATKGLAELYEEEHVKNADPDAYVSQSDEKLQREEKEIEAMWRDISARLDALSSWHYKPKPVAPAISVVADVATVAMEDAQPSTVQAVAGESSRMAPQEVYRPGDASDDRNRAAEVVTKGGMPLAKQELSREDKARRRRREKERVRKAGGTDAVNNNTNTTLSTGYARKAESRRAKMQRETMAELKKGGVKVINRKGEITDVDGNKAKKAKAVTSGGFKL